MKNSAIIHVPHSSIEIPNLYEASFYRYKLPHELAVMSDWFCEELFDCGRDMIIYPVSRLLCDVERFRDDEQEVMAQKGMGAVYQNCSDFTPLREITLGEREDILRTYYDVHHKKFTDAVKKHLEQYGKCLIVDGHSFPASPLPYELDSTADRPDFCIGTSEYHTPSIIKETLCKTLESCGYSVCLNRPFAGTIVPMAYYGKEPKVMSVMIEVNRKLYLDAPGVKNKRFSEIRSLLGECIEQIEKCTLN